MKNVEFNKIKFDDKEFVNGSEIANKFNEMFIDIGCNANRLTSIEAAKNCLERREVLNNFFEFNTVTPSKISKVLANLKNKRAAGWDDIPVQVLKNATESISEPLSLIINQCFHEGIFPNQLKYANVIPIYKKYSKENPENYRPVSVLPSLSKIFEKIAHDQLSVFLNYNKVICKNQYGFQTGKSTVDAAAELIKFITQGLDGSQSTAGIFCDLSKAFDCVNHKLLIEKLHFYGISGAALCWFISYLTNRKQRVIINKNNVKYTSSWKVIKNGVPQGSILGPLLFILYINDLPFNINHADVFLYADDTSILLRCIDNNELRRELERILTDIKHWFDINGLKLNEGKTEIIKFQTQQNKNMFENSVTFDNNIINIADVTMFLGLNIDKNVTWKPFIEKLVKRLSSLCFQMYILRETVDFSVRLIVYHACFCSLLQYGLELWGNSTDTLTVFRLQKAYIRTMLFMNHNQSCRKVFKEINILTLPSLYIFKCLVFVHKNMDRFSSEQHSHSYNTRFKNQLQYPIHRLKLFENTPYYMGLKFYNKLPNCVKELNINKFKIVVKKLLINKEYYDVNEFLNDQSLTFL